MLLREYPGVDPIMCGGLPACGCAFWPPRAAAIDKPVGNGVELCCPVFPGLDGFSLLRTSQIRNICPGPQPLHVQHFRPCTCNTSDLARASFGVLHVQGLRCCTCKVAGVARAISWNSGAWKIPLVFVVLGFSAIARARIAMLHVQGLRGCTCKDRDVARARFARLHVQRPGGCTCNGLGAAWTRSFRPLDTRSRGWWEGVFHCLV